MTMVMMIGIIKSLLLLLVLLSLHGESSFAFVAPHFLQQRHYCVDNDYSWSHSPSLSLATRKRSRSTTTILQARSSPLSSSSSSTSKAISSSSVVATCWQVGSNIGSGSYGTVHLLHDKNDEDKECVVGKRAWTLDEIKKLLPDQNEAEQKGRYNRCKYYWTVEKHCFETMSPPINNNSGRLFIPNYIGTVKADDGLQWMLFEKITVKDDDSLADPAPSMQDLIDADFERHQEHAQDRLLYLSSALGVSPPDNNDPEDLEYLAQTMDMVMQQMLEILVYIHKQGIVHRDVKPSNLLVSPGGLVLIDLGSAADLNTAGLLQANIGLSENVAISPIYAAPELFVDPSLPRAAVNFDVFSAALIACQVLFQYLDERTDAGFFRQLAQADYSLDAWLETELAQDVRSAGLEQGLAVLAYRPGLWKLLQNMLLADPRERYSSQEVLEAYQGILQRVESGTAVGQHAKLDSPYLADVLESLDLCSLVDVQEVSPVRLRPLHYVATFRRSEPLGLLLAESDGELPEGMTDSDRLQWQAIQSDAFSGQVFVQGVVPGSQADQLGIFQVGDRLQGIGELPLAEGGFEKALELIQDQPRRDKFITLHLDRRPSAVDPAIDLAPLGTGGVSIIRDQGAWSSRGMRSSQEDRFVLNEIHDTKERSLVLAGVFDGHLGTAACDFLHDLLPDRVTEIIGEETSSSLSVDEILERAWNEVCSEYRRSCSKDGECVADYDPREGTLDAYTGGVDAVAGTTGSMIAFDQNQGKLAILNCGDSRSLIIDDNGKIMFRSQDHQPEFELERFAQGIEDGLPYNQPECRLSKWRVTVGDYNYAVSRSLEGPFATSMGIISTPDISLLRTLPGTTALVATDGLWEVIDVTEIARVLNTVRKNGVSAADAAKALCSMALEKGSRDNISAVVVYVD